MDNLNMFRTLLDPVHAATDPFSPTMSRDIWKSKYAWGNEANFAETAARICKGIYAKDNDPDGSYEMQARWAMEMGLWMPAGRIMAGAGTDKRVTLINCYVNARMKDSMESIMEANGFAALTMQQGGGVGTAFSQIRPKGAVLKRTGTAASGPLPFMDMWNSMCATIKSAGDRRGAMMATMADWHPDLLEFVTAKQTKGRLTNFNVSVLISDAFMEAVKEDATWALYFSIPPITRDSGLEEYDFVDNEGTQQYVYAIHQARDLWETITRATYQYSEPGVIFIDRINRTNNLWYVEYIDCTNPCGEQPLPPHGACDLGHINLARLVRNPFKANATFDFELLRLLVRVGVRFLDNVIDVTNYPLSEQSSEQRDKRRIGLGYTGLADVFAQLRIRYGTMKSADLAEKITRVIAEEAYDASIMLAKQKGPFPLFSADNYLAEHTFAGSHLSNDVIADIRKYGIRNSHLMSIAPTGTTSLVYGNPGSGLEPFFALHVNRKVLQEDNSYKQYPEWVYAARLYKDMFGEDEPLPSYFVTMADLTVDDHIIIQGRVQEWVDASVSKTINLPESATYEEFVKVYDLAYNAGCKGCTTYRPSDVRGSILTDAGAAPKDTDSRTASSEKPTLPTRPSVLHGTTYKIKWPRRSAALYLTINEREGQPFEVFITSKDASAAEWTTALTLMISALFRAGGDVSFIASELKQIQSVHDGAWMGSKYFGSLPAYIGHLIEEHLLDPIVTMEVSYSSSEQLQVKQDTHSDMRECPQCHSPSFVKAEGCDKCMSCGYSHCG